MGSRAVAGRTVAGSLLILGFVLLMVAAIQYSEQQTPGDPSTLALEVGLVITALGVAAVGLVLEDAGYRIAGRLTTVAFLIGAVPWLTTNLLGSFTFEAERAYVVLACLTVVIVSSAMMSARMLPVVVGWACIAYALVFAVLYVARIGVLAPLLPNLPIVAFGVFLLLGPTDRRAQSVGSDVGPRTS